MLLSAPVAEPQHVAFSTPLHALSRRRTERLQPCSVLPTRVCSSQRRGIFASVKAPQKVFFVLGNAGSGKGTQCARLVDEFGCSHISAGDLLRAEVDSGSERGALIADIIREGRLVPGHITIELLRAAIEDSSATGVLIDGFPRDVAQAESFTRDVSDFEFALYFDCPEEELVKRLLKRGESSGRTDDNLDSIRKRFKTFEENCKPVVDLYAEQGKVVSIDALRGEDEIFADIRPLFVDAFAEEGSAASK